MAPSYPDDHGNGWREWSKYVLKELERLNSCYETIDRRLHQNAMDVAMLKVKAGAFGGALGVIGGAFANWVLKGMGT